MNCEDCDIYVCETTACVTVDKYEPHALTPAVLLPARQISRMALKYCNIQAQVQQLPHLYRAVRRLSLRPRLQGLQHDRRLPAVWPLSSVISLREVGCE
jgi:hypothetical protein